MWEYNNMLYFGVPTRTLSGTLYPLVELIADRLASRSLNFEHAVFTWRESYVGN